MSEFEPPVPKNARKCSISHCIISCRYSISSALPNSDSSSSAARTRRLYALETSGSHVFVARPIEMVRIGLGAKAVFSYCGEMKLLGDEALNGPVAQLDRVADFYSAGCRFESCRDRQ